jgi:hyperosmotically inducible protein
MTKQHPIFKFLTFSVVALSIGLAIGLASPALAESAGQYIHDATITAKVEEAIIDDSHWKVMQVKVDTTDGTVLLRGVVDTSAQELEAVKMARQVEGVTNVTDNMAVRLVNND